MYEDPKNIIFCLFYNLNVQIFLLVKIFNLNPNLSWNVKYYYPINNLKAKASLQLYVFILTKLPIRYIKHKLT